ncbi:MAG: hypothetical protein JJU45_11370 [Acidimicrobiia bacterium]|nr:hypothetical protein [Acidimicrobiia bacterium]
MALLAASCTGDDGGGDSAAPVPVTDDGVPIGEFSGVVDGTDAFVAVVSNAEALMVYVCDDGGVAEWFTAWDPQADMTLESASGAEVAVELAAGRVSGSVTLADGATHDFEARPSDEPVLLRAEGTDGEHSVVGGWIRVGDEQRGSLAIRRAPLRPIVQNTRPATPFTAVQPRPPITTTTTVAPQRPTRPQPVSPVTTVRPVTTTTTRPPTTTTTRPPTTTTTAPPRLIRPEPSQQLLIAAPQNLFGTIAIDLSALVEDGEETILEPEPVTAEGLGQPTPNRPLEFTFAALGDSYGSGEGAPVAPGQFSGPFDYVRTEPSRAANWGAEPIASLACHRSEVAGAPLAVEQLRQRYPEIPVDFIFTACSGAEIRHALRTADGGESYVGSDRHVATSGEETRPQLDRVEDWAAGHERPPDAVYLSIGGNNVGFANVISACIVGGMMDAGDDAVATANLLGEWTNALIELGGQPPQEAGLGSFLDSLVACDRSAAVADMVANGLPDVPGQPPLRSTRGFGNVAGQYDLLAESIHRLGPDGDGSLAPRTVLLSHYPDPTLATAPDGSLMPCFGDAGRMAGDLLSHVDANELAFAQSNLLVPLNDQVAAAVRRQREAGRPWRAVSEHTELFVGRGFCDVTNPFVNTMNAALDQQGDDLRDPELREMLEVVDLIARVVAFGGLAALGVAASSPDLVIFAIWAGLASEGAVDQIVNMSSGVMHPNRNGHEAYGVGIFAELEPVFIQTFTPASPTNVEFRRQRGSDRRVLQWQDRSDVETFYKVELFGLGGEPIFETTDLPADAQVLDLANLPGPAVRAEVRACNPHFCSVPGVVIDLEGLPVQPAPGVGPGN